MLRIAGTASDSIVDGPGLRFTIFTQGCPITARDAIIPKRGISPAEPLLTWSNCINRLFPILFYPASPSLAANHLPRQPNCSLSSSAQRCQN